MTRWLSPREKQNERMDPIKKIKKAFVDIKEERHNNGGSNNNRVVATAMVGDKK